MHLKVNVKVNESETSLLVIGWSKNIEEKNQYKIWSIDTPEDFITIQLLQYALQFFKKRIGIALNGKVSLLVSLPLLQQLSCLVFAAIFSPWRSLRNSKII